METDRTICPICGKPNNCRYEAHHGKSSEKCWCADEVFPKEIFEFVPEEKLGKACVCRDCLRRFQQNGFHNTKNRME